MTDQPLSRAPRRRLMLAAAIAIGLIAVILVGTYAARIPIAKLVASEILADTPFENATFRLVALDEDHLVLEELEADYPFAARAARVSVTYDPLAALDGIIESITVAGLDATLTPDQLTNIAPSDGSTGDQPLTIGRLTVDNGVVTVVLDEQPVRFNVDGEIDNLEPLSGMLDVTVAGPGFRFDGPIAVAVTDDGAGQTVTWRIDGGDIQRDELTIAAITGQILVARPSKDGVTLTVAVSLASPGAAFPPYDTGPFDLDLSATIDLRDAPVIETAAATLELGGTSEPIHVRLAADISDMAVLSATANIEIGRDLAIATGPELTISAPSSLTSQAEAALPDTWIADIDRLPDLSLGLLTSFSATFDSAGINIDGYAGASSASGGVALRPNGSETAIMIGPETAISGLVIDPDRMSSWGLPEDMVAALQTPVDMAIVSTDEPLQLRSLAGGGYMIDGKTGLSLAQADRTATLLLDGRAQLDGETALETAFVRDGAITVSVAELSGVEDFAFAGNGRAEYSDNVWHAEFEINGSAARATTDDLRIDNLAIAIPAEATLSGQTFELAAVPVVLISASATHVGDWRSGSVELDLPLRLAGSLEKFSIYLDDNGWIDLAGLTHPRVVVDQPTSIKLEQMGLPVLILEPDDDGFPVWDARLKIAPPSSTVTILDDDGLPAAVVSGTLPTMSVHATQLIASYLTATLESNGGSLTWVDQDIVAADLKTLITYNTGLSPWPQLHLEIDSIDDLAIPKRFATLSSDIRIAPVWPQGDDVRLSLNVHAPDRRYALNVEASYQPAKDLASALVRLPTLPFEPGGYQPSSLSPMLAPYATDISGSVELTGDITWQAGEWSSDLDLALREISATAFGGRIERLNSLITFDGIVPPSTPPGQLVAIGGIDAGLPLRDALISLSLDRDGALHLESATMKFAGGEVTADPLVWHHESDLEPLNLHVTGVNVGALFTLAELDDLTATGTLDGTIPVRLVDDDVVIEGARLASREPGELHYLPDGAPTGLGADDASIDLVLAALSNFHYDRLDVDLSRAMGGETEVGLHIAGSNPDLCDGYPIELNVNLIGELDRIVRDSLASYRIPDEIKQRLSGF